MSHYGVLVYDIEANGLYYPWEEEVADRIHCIAATDHSGNVYVYVNDLDLDEAREYCFRTREDVSFLAPLSEFNEDVKNYDGLVCHNQLHYDLPMLKKFIGLDYDFHPQHVNGHRIQIIDTLVDSRWLYPDRPLPRGCPSAIKNPVTGKSDKVGPHGLMAWTFRTSGSKPVVHDWRNQPLSVYIDRCIEDAKNNLLVFNWLNREMAEWYKCSTRPEHWRTVRAKAKTCINVETAFSHVIFKQQEHGVGFNQELAKGFLPKLDQMIQEVRERVEPKLPKVPIPKSRLNKDWSFPAKCFNNDGKPSANLMKWIEKHNGSVWCDLETRKNKLDAYGKTFDFPLPDYIKTHEELTLYNSAELKKYLMQIGWKPVYWNYKKDPKTNRYMRDDDKQLIPTTPRLKDAATGMICPNLLDMDSDVAKDVVLFNSLKHRRQTIESTANEEKGYLNHPRLEYDGRLPAMATPCGAGTRRVTHRVVANVPKAEDDVVFGKELRSLFYVSEPDYYFIGYDASAIEARLEGNEAFPYDKGEYAKLLLEGDIHQANSEFFSERSGNHIKRGKAKGIKYACLPSDISQVLTRQGWKYEKDLAIGQEVLSYNTQKDCYEWDSILAVHHYPNAEVLEIKNKWFSMECTPNHRWYLSRRTGKGNNRYETREFREAKDLNQECKILQCSKIKQESDISCLESEFLGWLLSDGYYKWSEKGVGPSSSKGKKRGIVASIDQDKRKFYLDIKHTLDLLGVEYTEHVTNKTMVKFSIKSSFIRPFLRKLTGEDAVRNTYNWVSVILKMGEQQLKAFLNAFWKADGTIKDKNSIKVAQKEGPISEALIVCCNLLGYRVSVSGKKGECLSISANLNTPWITGQRLEKTVKRKTDVFCITTKNGTFVTKQGNNISITGNSVYGAGPGKIATMLDVPVPKAKEILEEYWQIYWAVTKAKDKLTREWNRNNQLKIKDIMGGPLWIRSEHSIFNYRLQNAGTSVMKLSAVLMYQWLKEEIESGLANKVIDYHDEAQWEAHKKLVKWKKIADEEEGKALQEQGYSKPIKVNNQWFVADSKVGRSGIESIRKAGEILRIKVPLTGEWCCGKNWSQTH